MNIEDPFCFYPGDFTLFYAVTLELMVRKLLDENGYDQKKFGAHIDMSVPINHGRNIYPWENVESAIEFTEEALSFIGCRVRWQADEERGVTIAVKLPKNRYIFSKHRAEVIDQLNQGSFESLYYDVKLGKRNTVFYLFGDEFGFDWRCLSNIVNDILKLCKGGLTDGNGDNAA